MERDNDDAVAAQADSFLSEVVPEAADRLATRYASDYDAAAGNARFAAWLGQRTKPEPVEPQQIPTPYYGSARGNRWNAVVDVSNVCWSPYLPPLGRQAPVWSRLALVMAAWRSQYGADARLELVADDSLVRVLGSDAREFLDLKRAGGIRTASAADAEILRLAEVGGLHVITRDHFIDHRPAHRWIEQAPERFHTWDTVGGVIRLAPFGIRARSAQGAQAVEVKRLRHSTGLDAKNPAHRKILQTRWNCENISCRQNAQWQGQLLAWPRVSPEGVALCPSCTRPLTALGPRATLHEVVAADAASHAELMRFPLEIDCPVIVGRGMAVKGIDLAMYTEGQRSPIDTVSRQHLMLRLTDAGTANWRLSVIDLNSTNGTTVERWTSGGFDPAEAVPPEVETHLGTRDRLILGDDAVLLRLSGKRYLAEPSNSPFIRADTVAALDAVQGSSKNGCE